MRQLPVGDAAYFGFGTGILACLNLRRAPMDKQENFGPEPINFEEENLQNAIGTFEKEIHAHGGDVYAAAFEVFRMMTGN
ncbi:hypothetical protein FB472_1886 [Rhodoglobus vestalii]|uniref:Uncharacterized protein n=2 Tax=Rhodoglobus vestalii TaxID=193384 RepID=A0A8H2K7F5_9MICO|nr:hypothetical protein FB472_1886 [Rhodoglobus vestalii]